MPTRKSAGKYCKLACHHEKTKNEKPHWFECSRCLASVGLGAGKTGKLIGKTKSSVGRAWRRLGVNSAKIQFPKTCDWWGCEVAASGWMNEYKPRFPDWSYIWHNELSNRKYHALPDGQKKKRNRRVLELRNKRHESNPILKKAHRERINKWKRENREKAEAWRKSNPDKLRQYRRNQSSNPAIKAKQNLRKRLREIMKRVRSSSPSFSFVNLIGCSQSEFRAHIESQFKSWMTWDNYGTRWHIDHILPCASFDHTDAAQVRQCWHWTNLRPLCAKKNMQKSDEITEPQMHLLLEHH